MIEFVRRGASLSSVRAFDSSDEVLAIALEHDRQIDVADATNRRPGFPKGWRIVGHDLCSHPNERCTNPTHRRYHVPDLEPDLDVCPSDTEVPLDEPFAVWTSEDICEPNL